MIKLIYEEEKDQFREARLGQLRQDIQEGLDSGPSVAWSAADIKAAGRARRPTKVAGDA